MNFLIYQGTICSQEYLYFVKYGRPSSQGIFQDVKVEFRGLVFGSAPFSRMKKNKKFFIVCTEMRTSTQTPPHPQHQVQLPPPKQSTYQETARETRGCKGTVNSIEARFGHRTDSVVQHRSASVSPCFVYSNNLADTQQLIKIYAYEQQASNKASSILYVLLLQW